MKLNPLLIFILVMINYIISKKSSSSNINKKKRKINNSELKINKQFKQRLAIYEKTMQEKEKFDIVQEYPEDYEYLMTYKNFIKEKIMDKAIDARIGKQNSNKINNNQMSKNFEFSFVQKKTKRTFPLKDQPEKFFTGKFETNINKLPIKGKTSKVAWSGTYWPMRNGITSVRYNTNEKNTIGRANPVTGQIEGAYDFLTSVNMYKQPDDYKYEIKFNKARFEQYVEKYYSPAEKYDLLVGDYEFTLTNQQKNEGKKYHEEHGGDIPTWFGICHGWAPAAYYFNEPKRSVNMTSPIGVKIEFLPDDIKALASLYLANAFQHTNFVGDICRVFKPNVPISDSETKLFLDAKCHTLNPGTMAIVLGNYIGIEKKNLVFDPESDPEVWNQPVDSYIMRYFNLITNEFSANPQDVKVPLKFIRKSRDSFLNFLSRQADMDTEYVVGVYTNITYTVETPAVHFNKPLPHADLTVESIAAIELDKNDNIIGGEWKYNHHPNFMWKLDESQPIESCCDKNFPNYKGTADDDLTNWAAMASSKGQVIRSVIDYLVNQSSINITMPVEQQIKERWEFLFGSS